MDSWRKNLANYSAQHVGQTLVYLNGTFEECRFRECNLGNLICDAMVSEAHKPVILNINLPLICFWIALFCILFYMEMRTTVDSVEHDTVYKIVQLQHL